MTFLYIYFFPFLEIVSWFTAKDCMCMQNENQTV